MGKIDVKKSQTVKKIETQISKINEYIKVTNFIKGKKKETKLLH